MTESGPSAPPPDAVQAARGGGRDVRRGRIARALKPHRRDTMSQDSGIHCVCGARVESMDAHKADAVLAVLDEGRDAEDVGDWHGAIRQAEFWERRAHKAEADLAAERARVARVEAWTEAWDEQEHTCTDDPEHDCSACLVYDVRRALSPDAERATKPSEPGERTEFICGGCDVALLADEAFVLCKTCLRSARHESQPDDTDLTEAEIDAMSERGVPVEVTGPRVGTFTSGTTVTRTWSPTTHRVVSVHQERPFEFSWWCSCGTHYKHQPFGDLTHFACDATPAPVAPVAADDETRGAL